MRKLAILFTCAGLAFSAVGCQAWGSSSNCCNKKCSNCCCKCNKRGGKNNCNCNRRGR